MEQKSKNEWIVCKICIALKGLAGKDLSAKKCPYAFKTEEELMKHIYKEHKDLYVYLKFIAPLNPSLGIDVTLL